MLHLAPEDTFDLNDLRPGDRISIKVTRQGGGIIDRIENYIEIEVCAEGVDPVSVADKRPITIWMECRRRDPEPKED